MQQLAALLIARQVIGNLKESAIPYMFEQLRLAKLSFDLWGALSPTSIKEPPGVVVAEETTASKESLPEDELHDITEITSPSSKRAISQAELESSLYRVSQIVTSR